MTEHFLTYEQSLAVKELGFDEPCFGWYDSGYLRIGSVVESKHVQGLGENLAPLKSQFFKWAREKYGICPLVDRSYRDLYEFRIVEKGWGYTSTTYEEAEDACINKIIKILKLK